MTTAASLPGGGFQLETLQTFFAVLTACFAADALCEDRLSPAFVAGRNFHCASALFEFSSS